MLTLWPIAKMKQRETLVEHFVLNYNREFKDNIRDVISILTINKFHCRISVQCMGRCLA
jgi:hypothetical protein